MVSLESRGREENQGQMDHQVPSEPEDCLVYLADLHLMDPDLNLKDSSLLSTLRLPGPRCVPPALLSCGKVTLCSTCSVTLTPRARTSASPAAV